MSIDERLSRIPSDSNVAWSTNRNSAPMPDQSTNEDFAVMEREKNCNRLSGERYRPILRESIYKRKQSGR